LWYNAPPAMLPAAGRQHYTTSCNTQSSAPEDGRDQRPKHVELIGISNKPLLLHLVGVYIIYVNDARSNKYQTRQTCYELLVIPSRMLIISKIFTYNWIILSLLDTTEKNLVIYVSYVYIIYIWCDLCPFLFSRQKK